MNRQTVAFSQPKDLSAPEEQFELNIMKKGVEFHESREEILPRGKNKEMPSCPAMAVPSIDGDAEAVEQGERGKDQLAEHEKVLGMVSRALLGVKYHYGQAARKLARPMCKTYIMWWEVTTRNSSNYRKMWIAVFVFLQTKDVKPHLLHIILVIEWVILSNYFVFQYSYHLF